MNENSHLTFSDARPEAELLPFLERFEVLYQSHFETDLSFLSPLLKHLIRGKGKRLRPLFFRLCQGLLGDPDPETVSAAVALELLHTASLIHDDVVDHADLRRGEETLNVRWGNKAAVLVGDYLFADILALCAESAINDMVPIVAHTARRMGGGELRQTLGREDLHSREAYYHHIEDKTASLFSAAAALAAESMKASAEERASLEKLGLLFGTLFQVRDDILDYIGDGVNMGKPKLQDAADGKMTLPLLLALEGQPHSKIVDISSLLRSDTVEKTLPLQAFVLENQGIEKAQNEAAELAERAVSCLDKFPASSYRQYLRELILADLERTQ